MTIFVPAPPTDPPKALDGSRRWGIRGSHVLFPWDRFEFQKAFTSPNEGIRKSQPLPYGTTTDPKDSGGNVQPADKGLPSTDSNKGTAKTTPRPEGSLGDKDSKGNKPPDDMEPINPTVADPSGTDELAQESDKEEVFVAGDDMEEENQANREEHQSPSPNKEKHEPSYTPATQESNSNSSSPNFKKFDNTLPLTKRKLIKASIEGYYEENIDHREQTDKLVWATMDSFDKTTTDRVNLLKALNGVTETLKVVQDAIKDDAALNKKVTEATQAYTKNYFALTELLSLVKDFDFQGLKSLVESLQADALRQDEYLASWAKSSNSLDWNLGLGITAVESSQADIRSDISFLKQDTSEIKSIMKEIYQAFKGQALTPSSEPPSHTETENVVMKDDTKKPESDKAEKEPTRVVPISTVTPPLTDPILEIHVPQREGKAIATDEEEEPIMKLVPALNVVRPDPDEPVRVVQERAKKIRLDPKTIVSAKAGEKFKKAQDAEHQVLKRTKVIKVVQERAKNIRLDPKTIVSAKAGEKYKKAQDAEHQVLKRLKPEPITDVKIHPNSKPMLDEMGPIIEKKKNSIIKDLMKSLGNSYERLKKNPEELGIQSALPAPVPKQAPSQSSGRKRKHMELEPEIKVLGLEFNRSLPEGVPFVNNMVIKELEYGIFFTDVFGDQAFQRWNDIHKVGVRGVIESSRARA
ncbi:hypothetical protein Tco_0517377 [Tanacetum coccineum]